MTPNNVKALMGGRYYSASSGKAKGRGYMAKKDADLTNAYIALQSGGDEALGERQKALLIQDQTERQQANAFRQMQEQALREKQMKEEAEEMELEAGRLKLAQARRAMMREDR